MTSNEHFLHSARLNSELLTSVNRNCPFLLILPYYLFSCLLVSRLSWSFLSRTLAPSFLLYQTLYHPTRRNPSLLHPYFERFLSCTLNVRTPILPTRLELGVNPFFFGPENVDVVRLLSRSHPSFHFALPFLQPRFVWFLGLWEDSEDHSTSPQMASVAWVSHPQSMSNG